MVNVIKYLIAIILIGIAGNMLAINRESIDGQSFDGIDVSNHNGVIDWDKVVKNNPSLSFVYVKASEGATYKDARYLDNIKGARKAGLKVGAYHYFRMTSSVEDQYENFINQLESAPFDLIPMVDVETNDKVPIKQFRNELRKFLDKIEKRFSVAPVIYGTNRSYNELCGADFDGKYLLYIGRYGNMAPVVKGKSVYTVWQYSEKGQIMGIPKPVDLCRLNPQSDMSVLAMPPHPSHIQEDDFLPKPNEPQHQNNVIIETKGNLTIYYPQYSRIDLATGTMPSKSDESVVFVCAGAFTGELKNTFSHLNIAGNHVSGGVFYNGYKCGPNNGVFTWSEGDGWHFYNNGHAFC